MKDLSLEDKGLSIKQTANLYGLTIDALYYYEKVGLVVPHRNEANGYRIYQGEDFLRLNIVSSMQEMDISLGQIKGYLDEHTLGTNIRLLREELAHLNDLLGRLRERQRGVESTLVRYSQALLDYPEEGIHELWLHERPYLLVCAQLGETYNIPLMCAQKAREVGFELNAFHMLPLFTTTTEVNAEGSFDGKSCMLYSETPTGFEDGAFPAGEYLSVTFRGSAERTPEIYKRMRAYAEDRKLEMLGDPIEFWTINEYVSDDEREFVHTLQLHVHEKTDSN